MYNIFLNSETTKCIEHNHYINFISTNQPAQRFKIEIYFSCVQKCWAFACAMCEPCVHTLRCTADNGPKEGSERSRFDWSTRSRKSRAHAHKLTKHFPTPEKCIITFQVRTFSRCAGCVRSLSAAISVRFLSRVCIRNGLSQCEAQRNIGATWCVLGGGWH